MREFSEQELVRREKLNFLRERGLDPFGHRFDVDSNSKEIYEKYGDKTKEENGNVDQGIYRVYDIDPVYINK